MKHTLLIFLIIGLILSLCACSADELALDSVMELSREELEEQLLGLSQEDIHKMWGEPDSFLSGLWGDIYLLPRDDQMIILHYGTDGYVSEFSITQRQVK